jgi:hypothetical protein
MMNNLELNIPSDEAEQLELENEQLYKIIWFADSPNPGYIEPVTFKKSELPVHNRAEVLGMYRDYVEVLPGSNLWHLCVDGSLVDQTHELWDMKVIGWDWDKQEVIVEPLPPITWDDIKLRRNGMLAISDTMFNFDTPDPLKTQWMEYRQLLRDLPARESAAGNTPTTVFWNDYIPPYPVSARAGIAIADAKKCVWYTAEPIASKTSKNKLN